MILIDLHYEHLSLYYNGLLDMNISRAINKTPRLAATRNSLSMNVYELIYTRRVLIALVFI